MKTIILIVSDSHGVYGNILDAIEKEKPDCCIHLGDGEEDLETVSLIYPNLPIYNVRGNCDGWSETPPELVLSAGGKRIYAVHGNLHHVRKSSMSKELLASAQEAEADIVLYGHTHFPVHYGEYGIEVINPGTIRNDSKACYAVLTIENGKTSVRHVPVGR